jgi:hypothetical protein
VIDHIPMTIEHSLNQGFVSSIKLALIEKLDVRAADAATRLNNFVSEDPEIIEKREKLKTRTSMLERMHAELRNFGI